MHELVKTGETVQVSVPFGVSGAFLEEPQKFSEIHRVFAEWLSVRARLQNVEAQLRQCNHPAWLRSFSVRQQRLKRDPKQGLIALVGKLEAERAVLQTKVDEARHHLLQIEPTIFDTVTTFAGPYLPLMVAPTRKRMPNLDVIARNTAIDQYLDEADIVICKRLDTEFPSLEGRPATGLPESWVARFNARTFSGAYRLCPRLVHTMFSKRRQKSQSP